VRIVPEVVPCESSSQEEADEGIRLALTAIIDAFTKPLSAEEASPTPKVKEEAARIVFQGQLDEVNRFFYKRGWGDGLPLVPPTAERVERMLRHTRRAPDDVVASIAPAYGAATVERIAINAVMAGADPFDGTCTMSTPASALNNSPERCVVVRAPDEA